VKFLCDRCKTRYSIGDERVRGKILKIRCKNCANVITVREGMPDVDAGSPRRTRTTTAAPMVQTEAAAPAGKNALGAAFASAMTKPPPALEEEWYVSNDGEQEGPFSLAQAQRWVSGKPYDADLHCWSEGFDDWLPVDKVSHFRGLRKKPAPPPMPPPVPRGPPGRAVTAAAPRAMQAAAMATPTVEEEPKPLFAATMASLEQASSPSMAIGGAPGLAGNGMHRVGANGLAARAAIPSIPAVIPTIKPVVKPMVPAAAQPVPTARGLGLRAAVAPKPMVFDSSDGATVAESPAFQDVPTATEPPPDDPIATVREEPKRPLRSLSSLAGLDPAPAPAAPSVLEPPTADADEPEDDDLDIGEVSRVVNLADLMKQRSSPATKRTGAIPKLNGTGAVTARPGVANVRTSGTASVPLIDAVDAVPGANPLTVPDDVPAIAPAVAASHRRGMIALLVGAVLLLGAAGVFVFTRLNNEEDATSLGGQYTYNGQRPDDPIRHANDPDGSNEPPVNPYLPPKPPVFHRPQPPRPPPELPSNSLSTDDIEAMARSTSTTTTVCFRRADRGADAIRLADIKKIKVTFKVAKDGTVSNVALSEKSSASLVSCLTRMIQGWKFKPNGGGNFGFVFAKPS